MIKDRVSPSMNRLRLSTPEPRPTIGRAISSSASVTRPALVLHVRKSCVTLAARLIGKTAAEAISVMLAVFDRIAPTLRESITFDNDTAFAPHGLLRTMRTMTTWFCDAYEFMAERRIRKRQCPITTLVAASHRHRQSVG